jgi:hypothetical protein
LMTSVLALFTDDLRTRSVSIEAPASPSDCYRSKFGLEHPTE